MVKKWLAPLYVSGTTVPSSVEMMLKGPEIFQLRKPQRSSFLKWGNTNDVMITENWSKEMVMTKIKMDDKIEKIGQNRELYTQSNFFFHLALLLSPTTLVILCDAPSPWRLREQPKHLNYEECSESRISCWLYATVIEDNLVHRVSSSRHRLNETWRGVKLPQNPSVSCKFCILFSRSCHLRFSRTKFTTLRVNCLLFETNYLLKTVTMARRFHVLRLRLLTSILATEEVREMADSARRRLKQLQQSKI